MLTFTQKGDLSTVTKYFKKIKNATHLNILNKYGQKGVNALQSATPVDTGKTASSWYYEVSESGNTSKITFSNSNIQNGVQIAIILQYGHGTGTGGWVEGRDYINPAILPIFDGIATEAWKEVTSV